MVLKPKDHGKHWPIIHCTQREGEAKNWKRPQEREDALKIKTWNEHIFTNIHERRKAKKQKRDVRLRQKSRWEGPHPSTHLQTLSNHHHYDATPHLRIPSSSKADVMFENWAGGHVWEHPFGNLRKENVTRKIVN